MRERSNGFWLALCGAWLITVVVADIVLDREGHHPVVLVGLVIGAPLLASIRLNARRTAFVGALALCVAAVLWHINAMPAGADSAARLAALVCACAFGVLAARRREQLQALSDQRRLSATRAEFLAAATTELVSSLDYVQTLAHVARAAVPALTDRCVIDIDEGRDVRRVAEYGAAARGSAVAVPIVFEGQSIGSITFANGPRSRVLDDEDRTLVVDLAARTARAVEHARINAERDHIARTLQASLFPPTLPSAPGLELAARYRAARGGADVGGDFYDCFPLGDGEWVTLVGDVQGKGVEAATVASLIHHSLRTIAVQQDSPARMLEQLNDVVLRRREGCHGRFCTLALVRLRAREDGGFDACVALAGHAQPLVRRADGAVEAVGAHGTLIGAVPDVRLDDASFTLDPGDLLLLFSDGITESRRSGELLGERGLCALLAGTGDDADHVCERLVLAASADVPADDIALLAVEVPRVESRHGVQRGQRADGALPRRG
ncbi:SpoIIE family protein phosphatase [Solirubrobacter sp. CPCC 204708]|uniref:SpoIIE family protein phosphatase n=1 Tax=Solirubrobacter deserti TaxID=2282478 RepID=A0ABT4RKB3_9ACTN|nr:SpoIIE family protein phosphatase [Solirubrobacter deserti]MBE2315876.1 SpoIIE family protein phosphatase [Solirubrobacter deserti]MDA0138786.1 SpoIIE family protein phosphatase [Solirubrobacter deserti]